MPESDQGRFIGALDVPLELPLASAGSRSLAYLADWLCLLLIALVLILVLQVLGVMGAVISDTDQWGLFVALLIVGWFTLEMGWFIAFEQAWNGQTPGKRLVGLRVVTADGGDVGVVGSLIRNLARPLDLFPGGGAIGVASMVLTERHQRLGDRFAGTVVVVEREARAAPRPTRFPEGFRAEDVVLVEAFFARVDGMEVAAQLDLARKLLTWIRRDHPGFLPEGADIKSPLPSLRAAFAVTG